MMADKKQRNPRARSPLEKATWHSMRERKWIEHRKRPEEETKAMSPNADPVFTRRRHAAEDLLEERRLKEELLLGEDLCGLN